MQVTFHLKSGKLLVWHIPNPDPKVFNFYVMIKSMRADGHFIADNLYIQSSEVVAVRLEETKN